MGGVLSRPRATTSLVGFFSGAALVLAAIGIYGILSFSVVRRTREIGVRMALGAQAVQIRALVIRQSMKLIGAGIAIGIPASLVLSRFFSTLLFGVAPADALTMTVVLVTFVSVGWIAAYLPARRATRIDAVCALRTD